MFLLSLHCIRLDDSNDKDFSLEEYYGLDYEVRLDDVDPTVDGQQQLLLSPCVAVETIADNTQTENLYYSQEEIDQNEPRILCETCGLFECLCDGPGYRQDLDTNDHNYGQMKTHARTGRILTRKRNRDESQWRQSIRKRMSQSGEQYMSSRGKEVFAKVVQPCNSITPSAASNVY